MGAHDLLHELTDAGFSVEATGDKLVIRAEADPPLTEPVRVQLVRYTPEETVAIKRGENAGSTVAYHNVVRKIVPAGMWHGDEAKLVLPKASVVPKDCKGWVALLQTGKVGPVIGVATGGMAGS